MINKAAFLVPTAIISGVGVAAAGYYTYKYFQNTYQCKGDSSSSESYYTTQGWESEDEYFDVPEEEGPDITEDLLYEKWDELMEGVEDHIEEAYLGMTKCFEEMSEYPNFLWRYAKVHHLMGKVEESKARELNEKGLVYAKKALDKDPQNPEAHKWFAVTKGMEAEFSKSKTGQIQTANIFYQHIQEALKRRPRDWELHHLLGVFEYKLASLSSFEKMFARQAFKGISTCEYSAAETHFRRAETYRSKPSKDTKLFLAKCFYGMKDFKRALTYLNEALEINVTSIHDKISHQEAKELRWAYTTGV